MIGLSPRGNPYFFTGREWDRLDNGLLKLYYYRARSYDPQTGRFLQRDPLGVNPAGGIQNPFDVSLQYLESFDLYEYVNSNPNRDYDPFGYCTFIDLGKKDLRPVYRGIWPFRKFEGLFIDGQTTLKKWNLKADTEQCTQKCERKVVLKEELCSGDYWWSDDSISLPHELTHVGIWKSNWQNVLNVADSFKNKCMKKEEAKCYASVINKWALALYYEALAENKEFDNLEYGAIYPEVGKLAIKYRQKADEKYHEAMAKQIECDNM